MWIIMLRYHLTYFWRMIMDLECAIMIFCFYKGSSFHAIGGVTLHELIDLKWVAFSLVSNLKGIWYGFFLTCSYKGSQPPLWIGLSKFTISIPLWALKCSSIKHFLLLQHLSKIESNKAIDFREHSPTYNKTHVIRHIKTFSSHFG